VRYSGVEIRSALIPVMQAYFKNNHPPPTASAIKNPITINTHTDVDFFCGDETGPVALADRAFAAAGLAF
jgi:hypothetical protein